MLQVIIESDRSLRINDSGITSERFDCRRLDNAPFLSYFYVL